MINERLHEAVDKCNTAAGSGPGWNRRFRRATADHGVIMLDRKPMLPDSEWIVAPHSMQGDAHGWHHNTYLVLDA